MVGNNDVRIFIVNMACLVIQPFLTPSSYYINSESNCVVCFVKDCT